jgi:hypothetical protein
MNMTKPVMFAAESPASFCDPVAKLHSVSTNPSYPSPALTTSPAKKTVMAGNPKYNRSFCIALRTIPCLDLNDGFFGFICMP